MCLPAGSVSDAVLESLCGRTELAVLILGYEDDLLPIDITAAAVTRSVRLLTTQAAAYPHPEVDILAHGCISTP